LAQKGWTILEIADFVGVAAVDVDIWLADE
jgi:hypothetical protein